MNAHITSLSLFVGLFLIIGSRATSPETDVDKAWRTDGRYFISKRMYKRSEAWHICNNDEDDFQLVEIQDLEKSISVGQFLLDEDVPTAWTGGKAGSIPFEEYVWESSDDFLNFTNWEITPDRSHWRETDWYESGIVILKDPVGKWLLKFQENLHPAFCEKVCETDD